MNITITPWMPAPAEVPRPVFAITDIHGMSQHFEAVQAAIARIVREDKLKDVVLVRLGDLIDRGNGSLDVLHSARRGIGIPNIQEYNLRGNHEQLISLVIDGPDEDYRETLAIWMFNGGWSVAEDIGWSINQVRKSPLAFRVALRQALGVDGVAFLLSLANSFQCGRYLFVHAGINPHYEIDVFLASDWRKLPQSDAEVERSPFWIRDTFLNWNAPFQNDAIVIHGHTPTLTQTPDVQPHRINIDTGCYRGGPLTALELRGREMRLLMASVDQDLD